MRLAETRETEPHHALRLVSLFHASLTPVSLPSETEKPRFGAELKGFSESSLTKTPVSGAAVGALSRPFTRPAALCDNSPTAPS